MITAVNLANIRRDVITFIFLVRRAFKMSLECCLAGSVEHASLDLGFVSLSPRLGGEKKDVLS